MKMTHLKINRNLLQKDPKQAEKTNKQTNKQESKKADKYLKVDKTQTNLIKMIQSISTPVTPSLLQLQLLRDIYIYIELNKSSSRLRSNKMSWLR